MTRRWRVRADRWQRRLRRFGAPEVVVGAAIVALWAAMGVGTTFGSPGVALGAAAVVVALHLTATETGNHALLLLTTSLVALLVIITLAGRDPAVSPLVFTVGGLSALVYSDLVRINHGRRRRARLERQPVVAALGGTALAGAVALAGIGSAVILRGGTGRNWLWMPAAVGALVVVTMALTILPVLRAPEPSRIRWRPGDRMPPPDRQELDPLAQTSPSWFEHHDPNQ